MRNRSRSPRKSGRRLFSRTASRTNKRNRNSRIMRGGYRL